MFIVIEGPDGAGKTTQAARLCEWLREAGREVVPCRDPGGTPLGDRLRSLLKDQHDAPIGMRAEMLLFMASRAQLVDDIVRPALARGACVVSDRYILSNVVYQGYAGGLPVADLWSVGQIAVGGLMPDLTILLDLSTDEAERRIGPPRDRIEDRGDDYRRRVRNGFLDASRTYPAPLVTLAAAHSPDDVAARIREEVSRAMGSPARA